MGNGHERKRRNTEYLLLEYRVTWTALGTVVVVVFFFPLMSSFLSRTAVIFPQYYT